MSSRDYVQKNLEISRPETMSRKIWKYLVQRLCPEKLVNTKHFNNRGSVSFLLLLQLHCYYLLYNRQRCWMILISNPIISEINRVNNCGHSSKICGKKNNLPLILTKSQNPQTKNLKFKAVPGTLRDWDHHHWIPKPILAQNGFDSPPLDPNRGSRGWTSGANQNT